VPNIIAVEVIESGLQSLRFRAAVMHADKTPGAAEHLALCRRLVRDLDVQSPATAKAAS
jgi:hypothetical protein